MQEKINKVIERYKEINELLSAPDTHAKPNLIKTLAIEQAALEDLYNLAEKHNKLQKELTELKEMIATESDHEMLNLLNESQLEVSEELTATLEAFEKLARKADPNATRSVIIEIRAGTGGEEAALFAAELYRMYLRYAEHNNWKTEQLSLNHSSTGGLKEVIFLIEGAAYGKLKFESGVHRVQRVPATEASGRIHTSASSVVVLPEAEDVEIDIKEEDLKVDVYRSSGPGGQSVNTTDSAVRITHIPTGIVVTCQDEKSQLKNKKKALSVLKSRLYDMELQKQQDSERSKRQSAIAGGDRSAKIRTYNFPQSRVTDHRIKVSWHNLNEIMDGYLDAIIESLQEALANES
ncbi:MAG: peptide chain release factor 1 [Candidatus Dojkabacteria bacterium]|uniref:Peptide chain release factor 1 n=2 Tax=Candidatus Dojkabacteria TaxID=74243 RepID=A0A136KJN1_9BACT|nr:MAG: Peptide chain release factor 1 [candidate division WS6 bacterium OLB21]MBW7953235.1 peptide chain release factor 1 [Candidatus Dojkabacteria bacterium]WKZ28380.1 MAG: peptide chain release factor 1 [Candidatus Dojkabacteria bacterium]